MSGQFLNAIKGTTSGTPGTGAFTPNAASSGFRAWSSVPTGWWGLVRFEDGTAWSLEYCYWNGTTLSRASTQTVVTSTGSHLTLTSAATAALVSDGARFNMFPLPAWRGYVPIPNATTTPTAIGLPAATATGTAAAGNIANTNYLSGQPRVHIASATTANAQAGYSTGTFGGISVNTSGLGGWHLNCRFGVAATLPTGPRLMCGMLSSTFVGNTAEPSAFVANYACFAKDSTDTNIQLLTNNGTSTGTKIDTGITLTLNGWYDASLWNEAGSDRIKALLVRGDTGAIFYSETVTDVPTGGLAPQCIAGLSATTGTAFTLAFGGLMVRAGGW